MIKYSKKGKVMQMKKMEREESLIVNYIAKAKSGRAEENSNLNLLKHVLTGVINVSYIVYTFCSMTSMLTEKTPKENFYVFFFLSLIFMLAIPISVVFLMFPADGVAENIKAARKFLLEAGQEATSENINLLLNRYYKGNWPKIEDMLYEKRTVFSAENIELISGNMSNENLKETLPAK